MWVCVREVQGLGMSSGPRSRPNATTFAQDVDAKGVQLDEEEDDEVHEGSSLVFNMEKKDSLAAYELCVRPGAKSGFAKKRAARCCKGLLDCCPIWNKRFFVLYGDFLYRYASNRSKKPKGVPLMVSSITLDLPTMVDKQEGHFLEVSDFRKEVLLKFATRKELVDWSQALAQAKTRAIRQRKGHVAVDRFMQAANAAGNRLYEQHIQRERKRMEVQMKELGMNTGLGTPPGIK